MKYFRFSTHEPGGGAECLSVTTDRFASGRTLVMAKRSLAKSVGCTPTYFDDPSYTRITPVITPTLLWRYSGKGSDYGSAPAEYITPLSPFQMVALALYCRFEGINGSSKMAVNLFKDGNPVLKLAGDQ